MSEEIDPDEIVDLNRLQDAGWFPGTVEVVSGAAAGSGIQALNIETPVSILVARERDSDPDSMSDREKQLRHEARVETFEMILRHLLSECGLDPIQLGATVLVWGWDLNIPPVDRMTQEDIASLLAQTRAAVNERHKAKVQRRKERVGQRGNKSHRQKREEVVETYRKQARGKRSRHNFSANKQIKDFLNC
ncbi:MAG: hypothetical protein AAF236_00705 [Verrucomicrobiota bacterium]